MSKTPAKPGSANGTAPSQQATPVQARVLAQYIKDLSFEVPQIDRIVKGPGENPNLQLEVNVNARHIDGNRFESVIEFNARASDSGGTIYELEAVYGGMFELQRVPEESVEAFLLVHCPSTLFPFLRRLVADLVRESNFPPLLLDPIDFGQLYLQRKREAAAGKPAEG